MCGVREGTLGLPASKGEGMGNEGAELRKTNVKPLRHFCWEMRRSSLAKMTWTHFLRYSKKGKKNSAQQDSGCFSPSNIEIRKSSGGLRQLISCRAGGSHFDGFFVVLTKKQQARTRNTPVRTCEPFQRLLMNQQNILITQPAAGGLKSNLVR